MRQIFRQFQPTRQKSCAYIDIVHIKSKFLPLGFFHWFQNTFCFYHFFRCHWQPVSNLEYPGKVAKKKFSAATGWLVVWFGQIQFEIWTSIQIYLAILTNIFENLDKYIWQFEQIHFATLTASARAATGWLVGSCRPHVAADGTKNHPVLAKG